MTVVSEAEGGGRVSCMVMSCVFCVECVSAIYLCVVSILLTRLPPQEPPSQTSRLALASSHTHSGHVYPQYEPVRQQSPRHLVLSQKTASCWFCVWGRVLCWGVQLLQTKPTNQPQRCV